MEGYWEFKNEFMEKFSPIKICLLYGLSYFFRQIYSVLKMGNLPQWEGLKEVFSWFKLAATQALFTVSDQEVYV